MGDALPHIPIAEAEEDGLGSAGGQHKESPTQVPLPPAGHAGYPCASEKLWDILQSSFQNSEWFLMVTWLEF